MVNGIGVFAPVLRGLGIPRTAKGCSGACPPCVLSAGPDSVQAGPGVLELSVGDAPEGGLIERLRASLELWRSERSLAAGALPGAVLIEAGGGKHAFVLGKDLDDARSKLEGNRFSAWIHDRGGKTSSGASSAAAAVAPVPGASSGREKVVAGKTALVTGGAQGFGEEIVRGLSASGAFVYIADMNLEGAKSLAEELNGKAGRTAAFALLMDVTNEESVSGAFGTLAETTGGLDICISNAGVLKAGSVLEQSLKDFRFVTEVNYVGFFNVTKAAAALMRLQGFASPGYFTDIIQINSKSGLEGSNRNGAYAGSKFGGIGLVQSFALELVECGIKVNAICPGNFFDGPLWSDPEKGLFVQYLRTGKVPGAKTIAMVKAFYEGKVPMGRGCEGPDVLRAIYYLVEQEYETGQAIPVTGGQVMLK